MDDNKHNEKLGPLEGSEEDNTKHFFETIGSGTECCRRVTHAASTGTIADHRLSRVGGTVTYDDGSEASIVDGAGMATVNIGRSVALIGSCLSNGERIVDSLQNQAELFIRHGRIISSLFGPTYVVLEHATEAV